MNKLILLLAAIITFGLGQAQAQTPKTAQAAQPAKTTTQTKTVHVTKSGAPDKRYKENKATKTVSGPLKKDGTPDMRYKANKTTKTTTTTTTK